MSSKLVLVEVEAGTYWDTDAFRRGRTKEIEALGGRSQ